MKRNPREIRLEPLEAKLNDYELKIGEGERYLPDSNIREGSMSIAFTKEELKRIYELIGNKLEVS